MRENTTMISVGDNVVVTLVGGGIVTGEIIEKPMGNQPYWTVQEPSGTEWLIGPSMVSMEKK